MAIDKRRKNIEFCEAYHEKTKHRYGSKKRGLRAHPSSEWKCHLASLEKFCGCWTLDNNILGNGLWHY